MKTAKITKSTDRINGIDFTRGILIVFMVIYHSLNAHGVFPYRFLPFVAPGFIMIAGFIITQVYFPKYSNDINVPRIRLAVRAIKLMMIFTILNMVVRIVLPLYNQGVLFGVQDFWINWKDIYLIGKPYQVSFDVLLPISYTLIISIIIPRFKWLTPSFIVITAISIFTASVLMEFCGSSIYTVNMMSAGIIGIAIGLIPLKFIDAFAKSWINIFFVFIIYGISAYFLKIYYYTQIFFTINFLLIIYSVGKQIDLKKTLPNQIIFLGRYSLLSYIIQIGYLKIFSILLSKWHIDKPHIIVTIFLITIVTYITILVTDRARSKFTCINALYKAVFV